MKVKVNPLEKNLTDKTPKKEEEERPMRSEKRQRSPKKNSNWMVTLFRAEVNVRRKRRESDGGMRD